MKNLQFSPKLLERPQVSGLDVETTLAHFSIITYMIDPKLLRPHIHERFKLDCILTPEGEEKALVSMVPFIDQDFRFVKLPYIKRSFAQTNYRVYVTDSKTGEHVAWFLGTSLDSLSVYIPRFFWKLPWHKAKINFKIDYDEKMKKYNSYSIQSSSKWANLHLDLEDTGMAPQSLMGFPDLDTGLVLLTHPTKGYYYLRNGKLGHYSIWHDKLTPTQGQVTHASISLFSSLGLVTESSPCTLHSVLIQPHTDFTVYLPPLVVESS